jgi:hypothetical protein
MLPSLHLELPEQEAAKEFASACKKALLRQIVAFLKRNPGSNRLLPFEETRVALGPWRQTYFLGRQAVPVERIVGSEGRYADFDDEFLPLKGSSEERWRSVYVALRRGEEVPPVSLLKVGDVYFVRDGNHRVSVARWLGVEALDADVVEMRAAVPIEATISTRDFLEGRQHLQPSVDPLYGPPAADGKRSERSTHVRSGGGDRACL